MPSRLRRRARAVPAPSLLLLAVLVALAVRPAHGAEGREDEIERWVPSFAFFFDMLGQKGEGTITTGMVSGPPLTEGGCLVTTPFGVSRNGTLCPMSTSEITPGTSSDDTSVAPLVGGSLELMTPRLREAFWSPRLFAHIDAAAAFGFERNLAGERDPGPFFAEPLDQSQNDVVERSVAGQGSRARMQVRRLVTSAGGGIAFTTRVLDRTLRIKPSFEYLREEVDLIGSVHRAVKLNQPAADLTDFRLVVLDASAEETLHGLGAGLELEVDSGRLGPFTLGLVLMGRGYRFLGNLDHTLTDTNEFGETASWDFELEPWAWRVGIGARFRWLPE